MLPDVWAGDSLLRLAVNHAPLITELKLSAIPAAIRQYPMSQETHFEILLHFSKLKQERILTDCQSLWNTLLLPIKIVKGDFCPVQDLYVISTATVYDLTPYSLKLVHCPESVPS